ncbi:hypothetical protein L2E82_00309 [Cichorium intybus]|uniref:Uncharacterized protein n=1 Tax=Cichorium intybus TaxID=13427 RepID=A0ACB9GWG8_CICIN|nr:hypothetical protein L2E82_00309 [Cichorium intybus]
MYWMTLTPNVEDYSGFVARIIDVIELITGNRFVSELGRYDVQQGEFSQFHELIRYLKTNTYRNLDFDHRNIAIGVSWCCMDPILKIGILIGSNLIIDDL